MNVLQFLICKLLTVTFFGLVILPPKLTITVSAVLCAFPFKHFQHPLRSAFLLIVLYGYNNSFTGKFLEISKTPRFGVSRMKSVDSSFQCCIEDGSRPTAYAVQTEYANHLKVLCLKGMVLNVQAKGVCQGIRYV